MTELKTTKEKLLADLDMFEKYSYFKPDVKESNLVQIVEENQ